MSVPHIYFKLYWKQQNREGKEPNGILAKKKQCVFIHNGETVYNGDPKEVTKEFPKLTDAFSRVTKYKINKQN